VLHTTKLLTVDNGPFLHVKNATGHDRIKGVFLKQLSMLRFCAFSSFYKVFVFIQTGEKITPKIHKCIFYSTLSICICRFQLQYISLKAFLSK